MKNVFAFIIVILGTVMLFLMFFIPNISAVKNGLIARLDFITFLLVLGLYFKDMFQKN